MLIDASQTFIALALQPNPTLSYDVDEAAVLGCDAGLESQTGGPRYEMAGSHIKVCTDGNPYRRPTHL